MLVVVSCVTGAHLIIEVGQQAPDRFELLRVLRRRIDEGVFEVPRTTLGEHGSKKPDLALAGLDDATTCDQEPLQAGILVIRPPRP